MRHWNIGLATRILASAALLAVPAPLLAADGEQEVVATEWSLEEAGAKTSPEVRRGEGTARPASRQARRRDKVRVFGSARASNSRLRSKKGSARVGVAVPF